MTPSAPDKPSALLDLIPLGRIDPFTISIIAAHLQSILGLFTGIRPSRLDPKEAFMAMRNQYDAAKIIKTLAAEVDGTPFKMAVTQSDICIPILTHVFGESQLGGRVAVISLHRLHHGDHRTFYNRAAKIAIHEAGHMLGLEHCWEVDCLMRFSKQLDQLDRLPLHFCSSCEYETARRLEKIGRNNGFERALPDDDGSQAY